MSLMKGWQYASTTGGIEKHLRLRDDLPHPSADSLSRDQVLIESLYVSLNPADYKGPEGGFFTRLQLRLPATPGYDFCGRVQAVHPSSQLFKPGDLVFGNLGHPRKYGTLCQYFVAYGSYCVPVPEGLSLEHAAAIGSVGIAAYKAVAPYIKSGHKVFINGGSGGVGIFAIQIARILGAEVTVSCSTRNKEFCQGLGAHVIDYTQGDLIGLLQEHGQMFDHVVDNVGTTPELYSHAHLFTKPDARIAQVGAETLWGLLYPQLVPSFLGGSQRRTCFVIGLPNREDLTVLGNWVAEGKIRIHIDEKFPFEHAIQAFEKLKTGHVRGKIIVEVSAP
ncbi:putative zinc alcohol dehydrogenase [Aspergillus sclerotiicarbonarius CBS 121057]|uniref:Putative zinc alcohol dehydrogenase n=1 Tax=Aspergillus sclerotiicarbonarius (strain CBS 121057 / IBT 28362) TaxID=1448318 RepID=A0A319EYS3_ASPSB|nr:putative zinc alcohol dehydrogenase [Aspergillus sclerotiicarbonarius CBS 121057]